MGVLVSCLGPPDLGIDSRYILQRKVGSGATGSVYLGIERLTGIQYALKFQEAGRAHQVIAAVGLACNRFSFQLVLASGQCFATCVQTSGWPLPVSSSALSPTPCHFSAQETCDR